MWPTQRRPMLVSQQGCLTNYRTAWWSLCCHSGFCDEQITQITEKQSQGWLQAHIIRVAQPARLNCNFNVVTKVAPVGLHKEHKDTRFQPSSVQSATSINKLSSFLVLTMKQMAWHFCHQRYHYDIDTGVLQVYQKHTLGFFNFGPNPYTNLRWN